MSSALSLLLIRQIPTATSTTTATPSTVAASVSSRLSPGALGGIIGGVIGGLLLFAVGGVIGAVYTKRVSQEVKETSNSNLSLREVLGGRLRSSEPDGD